MTRSQFLKLSMRRIEDQRDSEAYGAERDWSYLTDPYAIAQRDGFITARRLG